MMTTEIFTFDTKAICFLCLSYNTDLIKSEDGQCFASATGKKFSLRSICRYLKINFQDLLKSSDELLESTVPDTFQLLNKDSNVSVHLCDQCRSVTGKLSELCQELELVQMKIDHCLQSFSRLLKKADDPHHPDSMPEISEPLERQMFQLLRTEMQRKCNKKLESMLPSVVIETRVRKTSQTSLSPNIVNSFSDNITPTHSPIFDQVDSPNSDVDYEPPQSPSPSESSLSATDDTPKPETFPTSQCRTPSPNEDPEGKWKCHLCSFSFQSKVALQLHKRRVHIQKSKISKGYYYKSSVPKKPDTNPGRNLNSSRRKGTFICTLCKPPLTLGTERGHYRHQIHSHVESFFESSKLAQVTQEDFKAYCEHVFNVELLTSSSSAKGKNNGEETNPKFPCPHCQHNFFTSTNVRFHLFQEHKVILSEKIAKLQKSTSLEDIRAVELPPVVNKNVRYKCDACGTTFSQDTAYYRHKRHRCKFRCKTPQKKLKTCDDCGKQFANPDTLRRHRKRKHEPSTAMEAEKQESHKVTKYSKMGELGEKQDQNDILKTENNCDSNGSEEEQGEMKEFMEDEHLGDEDLVDDNDNVDVKIFQIDSPLDKCT